MVTYNGVDYAYIYNVQGDVIALVDSTGAKVVEYYYDAWGKILSVTGTLATTLGTLNPFRYRGYVFDEETGLYYLRSRYYHPQRGRFINSDETLGDTTNILAHNVYAYCGCNPIVFTDQSGKLFGLSLMTLVTTAVVGAIVGAGAQIVTNIVTGEEWHKGVIGAAVGGAVYNTVSILSYGDTALAAYASATAESFANEVVSYTNLAGANKKDLDMNNVCDSLEQVATDTLVNGTGYYVTGKLAEKVIPVSESPNPRKRHFRTVMRTEWGKQMFKQTVVQGWYNFIYNGGKKMVPTLN